MVKIKDVLRSLILEVNPLMDNDVVDRLIDKYLPVCCGNLPVCKGK